MQNRNQKQVPPHASVEFTAMTGNDRPEARSQCSGLRNGIVAEDRAKNHPCRHGRFLCSVEQRDDPRRRSKPVIVALQGNRSVVCAAWYEARSFGVRSAMPAMRAERLCPHATFSPPDFPRYRAVSRSVRLNHVPNFNIHRIRIEAQALKHRDSTRGYRTDWRNIPITLTTGLD